MAQNGDVFVSAQGRGGGVIVLRPNASGQAEAPKQFATGFTTSEVALFDGYLYTEAQAARAPGVTVAPGTPSVIAIVRYPLKARRSNAKWAAGHDRALGCRASPVTTRATSRSVARARCT